MKTSYQNWEMKELFPLFEKRAEKTTTSFHWEKKLVQFFMKEKLVHYLAKGERNFPFLFRNEKNFAPAFKNETVSLLEKWRKMSLSFLLKENNLNLFSEEQWRNLKNQKLVFFLRMRISSLPWMRRTSYFYWKRRSFHSLRNFPSLYLNEKNFYFYLYSCRITATFRKRIRSQRLKLSWNKWST